MAEQWTSSPSCSRRASSWGIGAGCCLVLDSLAFNITDDEYRWALVAGGMPLATPNKIEQNFEKATQTQSTKKRQHGHLP